MEQKRTIWIVLAAGIFLLVVLGAALILYAPEAKKNTTALYQRDSGSIWMSPEAAEYRKSDPYADGIKLPPQPSQDETAVPSADADGASVTAGIASPAEGTGALSVPEESSADAVTVIASESRNIYNAPDSSSTTIDLNALKTDPSVSGNVTAQNKAAENAIRETSAVHRNIEKSEVLVEKTYSAPKPAASKNKTAAAAVPAPKKAASAPAPVKKAADRFWVQAGSYTTTKNADEARSVLESNKIPCEVFTFTDAKGILHYRVRVGPYVTKSEAEYWKKRIDSMPLFAGNSSYITNTSAAK